MLTPLELDIMKAVWRRPSISVRDVQEAIRPGRQLAYTTVMTIMDRLYHKGFLARTLQSRTHYYEPTVPYADVREEAVDALIQSFFGSKEKLQEFLSGGPADTPVTAAMEISAPAAFDETLL